MTRRTTLIAVLLCAACAPLLLTAGFDHDETWQLAFLEGAPPRDHHELSRINLWSFSDGSQEEWQSLRREVFAGTQPWCTDTGHPLPKMRFLRVLSSATVALDHSLFGLNAAGYHLHTLLWFAALLLALGSLLERVLPQAQAGHPWWPALVTVALVLFAVDATHAEVMGRTATRHLLVAATFGSCGLLAHVLWRQQRLRGGAWIAVGLFLLGMLSSENLFQVLGYVVAFELVGTTGPWTQRARSLLPLGLLSGVYLVVYRALDFGASGDGYLDPFRSPAAFLAQAPLRFSDLFLEEALSLPAWLGWGASPWRLVGLELTNAPRLGLAATAVLGFGLWLRAAAREPGLGALRWLGLGSLLAILPALPGQPGPRLLLVPSIGTSVVVAGLVAHALSRRARGRSGRAGAWLLLCLGLTLAIVRGVAAPGALLSQLVTYSRISDAISARWIPDRAPIPSAAPFDPAPALDIIVLTAPSTSVPRTFLRELGLIRAGDTVMQRAPGQRWWFLSNNTLDFSHEWLRTGPNTFELATQRPRLSKPTIETLWIGCQAVPGMAAQTRIMRVRLLAAVAPGGIGRIAVELDRDLDDPSLWFVAWQSGALRRVAAPVIGAAASLD